MSADKSYERLSADSTSTQPPEPLATDSAVQRITAAANLSAAKSSESPYKKSHTQSASAPDPSVGGSASGLPHAISLDRSPTSVELPLRGFPDIHVEAAFSSAADVAKAHRLDKDGERTVIRAYELAREHIGPFNTAAASIMYNGLLPTAAANPNMMFGVCMRGARLLAAGLRGVQPEFSGTRCREITVSSHILEAAIQDHEAKVGAPFPLEDPYYRSKRIVVDGRVGVKGTGDPGAAKDAWQHLTSYLVRRELLRPGPRPDEPEGDFGLIDVGLRASSNDVLSVLYDKSKVISHCMFLTKTEGDANAENKYGHIIELPASYGYRGKTHISCLTRRNLLSFRMMRISFTRPYRRGR